MTDTAPTSPTPESDVFRAFDDAQRAAIRALADTVSELREGITEREVVRMAEGRARDHGFTTWFHRPHARFGGPATPGLGIPSGRRLVAGQIVELDMAPANDRAFGDIGLALAFGSGDEPPAVTRARELCRAACGFASRWKCTGEVFVYAQAWATNRGLHLGSGDSVGHVCFTRDGLAGTAWPKLARAAILARRYQVQWFNPRRMHGFYALQPRVVADGRGCAFEEMVFIDGDVKRIVGRGDLSEVGTW